MPDDKNDDRAPEPEEPFDRQAYLKSVRQEMLKNLGLPEDTKPEHVSRLLAIKAGLKKLKKPGDG
jgi:hypothetical protein